MDLNEEIYELIERYLNGELQGAELLDFERRIESVPQLKEEIKLQKELQQYFDGEMLGVEKSDMELEKFLDSKEAKDVQNILDNTLKKQKQKNKSDSTKNKKINWKLLIIPLLVLILLLLVLFYFNNENTEINPQQIFAEYNVHDNISITNKGDAEKILSTIENDFNNKNYTALENLIPSLLDTLPENNPNWSTLKLSEGIVALELNKNDEAASIFKTLQNSDYLNADEAAWYYILTLLKKGDKENAIKEINILLNSPSKYKEKELREILEDLD